MTLFKCKTFPWGLISFFKWGLVIAEGTGGYIPGLCLSTRFFHISFPVGYRTKLRFNLGGNKNFRDYFRSGIVTW